ncbi:MAG: hypothetical protein P8Y65_01785 [Campylobacterales bacterium]|jgi:hypothetical protein
MYLKAILPAAALLFFGCGENSNIPLAGDIDSLAVEANATEFYATRKVQMVATASYTNDVPDLNVTPFIDWSESNTSIAMADTDGVVIGAEYGGDVEITGSYKQYFDSEILHVHALTSVEINASDTDLSTVTQEQTLQLYALGTFDDDTTLDVTQGEGITWVLGNAGDSNASLEQNGTLYTGNAVGTLEINVTRYDVNDSFEINVTAP